VSNVVLTLFPSLAFTMSNRSWWRKLCLDHPGFSNRIPLLESYYDTTVKDRKPKVACTICWTARLAQERAVDEEQVRIGFRAVVRDQAVVVEWCECCRAFGSAESLLIYYKCGLCPRMIQVCSLFKAGVRTSSGICTSVYGSQKKPAMQPVKSAFERVGCNEVRHKLASGPAMRRWWLILSIHRASRTIAFHSQSSRINLVHQIYPSCPHLTTLSPRSRQFLLQSCWTIIFNHTHKVLRFLNPLLIFLSVLDHLVISQAACRVVQVQQISPIPFGPLGTKPDLQAVLHGLQRHVAFLFSGLRTQNGSTSVRNSSHVPRPLSEEVLRTNISLLRSRSFEKLPDFAQRVQKEQSNVMDGLESTIITILPSWSLRRIGR
jgi:hypothetical protein